MAYSAVASFIQTLEDLVKFPSLAFQINISLAKCFNNKVSEQIKLLEVVSNMWELKQFREELESVPPSDICLIDEITYLIDSILPPPRLRREHLSIKLGSLLHGTPKLMKEEKTKLFAEIDAFEAKLNMFLNMFTEIEAFVAKLNMFLDMPAVLSMRRDMGSYVSHLNYRWRELLLDYEILKEAITFFYDVTSEILFLRHNLQFLLTFLEDHSAECHHHIVDSIRDVAYGPRDLIEASMVDNQFEHELTRFLDYLSAKEKAGVETSLVDKVKQFFQAGGVRKYLLQIRKKAYSIRKQIEDMNCEREDLKTVRSTLDGSLQGNSNEDNVVVGLGDDITSIKERLTAPVPSRLHVLTIVGMGGIGKTTLGRKVFDHSAVVSHFHCRAWITISQVYEEKDLLFGLLCYVSQPTYKRHEKRSEDIGEDLYRKLKGRRYLIVMDDVWSIKSWNTVRKYLPDDRNGSRVILTSRSIITELEPEGNSYHSMRLLDRDQSWKLLEKVVFGTKSCPQELEDVGRQIASKCRGLPLAIVVVAGLLSRITRTKDCWEDIADNVKSLVHVDPKKCLETLALSYNKLPNPLKECFLYLGVFPEDCEVEVGKLVHLWVAEGFVVPKASKDPEQVAEDYLQELIGRNLVLIGKRSFDGKVKTCYLHDFLRELCLREARKEKFMHVIPKGAQGIQTSLRDLRRLSIHLDSFDDYSVPSFAHGHSFICFSLGYHFSPDILLFELHLKLLRVLDIYFWHFDSFPIQIIELVHLRYLALNVTYDLPASMSQLKNLQTILLCGPWGSPLLSLEYWSMPSLRHLISSAVCRLKFPPIRRKEMFQPFVPDCIQSLSTISFSSCKREVFCILPQLKKLGIHETKEDYSAGVASECLANLQCLSELEILKCSFYGRTGKVRDSGFFASLSNLKKLTLSWSYLPWKDMALFSKLGQLQVLKLKNFAFRGPRWELTEEVFNCLKSLLVVNTDLVLWEATSTDHFPCLEHLLLRSCKSLEEIPCGVGELPTLSLLELHHCRKSAENSAKEFGEQFEYVKVVTTNKC